MYRIQIVELYWFFCNINRIVSFFCLKFFTGLLCYYCIFMRILLVVRKKGLILKGLCKKYVYWFIRLKILGLVLDGFRSLSNIVKNLVILGWGLERGKLGVQGAGFEVVELCKCVFCFVRVLRFGVCLSFQCVVVSVFCRFYLLRSGFIFIFQLFLC